MYNPEYILYYITVKSEQKLSIDIEFQAKHVLCVRNDKLLVRFHWFYTRIISSNFFLDIFQPIGQRKDLIKYDDQ